MAVGCAVRTPLIFAIWLSAIIVVPMLSVHAYPEWGCSYVEHAGPLDETRWYSASGADCGYVRKNYGGWYAFHENGVGLPTRFNSRESAYESVEWWCRP